MQTERYKDGEASEQDVAYGKRYGFSHYNIIRIFHIASGGGYGDALRRNEFTSRGSCRVGRHKPIRSITMHTEKMAVKIT